jgi:hypothetical protein
MDAGMPAGNGTNPAESAARATHGGLLPTVSIAVSAAFDVALFRYAIDLLAPLCAAVLITHTVRDAIGDWLAGESHDGESDPAWIIGVLGVNLFAAVLGLLWIFSTSSWVAGTRLAASIPDPVVRMANFGEEHGWGRRAVLPGGPVEHLHLPMNGSAGASVGAARRQPPDERAASLLESPARPAGGRITGTSGQAPTTPRAAVQKTGSIRTSIALASSGSVLRVGSEVLLTATVTALRGRVSGRVVFRRADGVMGSARVDGDGRAALRVRTLPRGTHTITAEFIGHADFAHSRSGALTLTVTP